MRHTSTRIIIFLLLLGAVLSGYNFFQRPFLRRFSQSEKQEVESEPETDPLQLALDQLSVSEKILQTIALPIDLDEASASVEARLTWLAKNQPGFTTIFGTNLTAVEITKLTEQLMSLANPHPVLTAVDHEGGTVQRLRGTGFSSLPAWRQICQLETAERTELLLQSAKELNQAGVQIVFAPVLDIARAGSFLGNRACTSVEEVAAASRDYITSFGQFDILPVIKHFPGIGSLITDPHQQLDTISLGQSDTLVFNQVLGNFPNLGVMTAHVAIQDKTAGLPCSLSALCLEAFPTHFPQALLFTDGLEMAAAGLKDQPEQELMEQERLMEETSLVATLTEPRPLSERASLALLAGNDVLVFGKTVTIAELDEVVANLVESYERNELFAQRVNAAVGKVLLLKLTKEN